MKDVNSNNFGLLIAYLVPGFIAVYGVSLLSPTVQSWLTASSEASPTVSGFLFGTLTAIAAGLVVNAIRWHIVDPLHYWSGVQRKTWDYPRLAEQIPAFLYLVNNQFRYYECYANTMVATAFAGVIWFATSQTPTAILVAALVSIQLVLWSASRRTLQNYHRRIQAFLEHLDEPSVRVPERIDPSRQQCYTSRSTIHRRRVIFPFLVRRQ